ncbi:hypothetical protein ACFPIF_15545 [Brevundimonas faecalis]|uniref:hypothetical protein n=1 Tax=Brevundimonas faecalis TaxID=947378 RepID=UPI0036099BAC
MNAGAGTTGCPSAWYVAFFDGERPHWWWRLCKPGFRHVAAFGYCAEQAVWLLYDVTLKRTFIHVLTSEQMDQWVAELPGNRTIVHMPARDTPPVRRVGFWCTPAVAHLLGAPSRALRPEGLYRDLMALGARPAFSSEPS